MRSIVTWCVVLAGAAGPAWGQEATWSAENRDADTGLRLLDGSDGAVAFITRAESACASNKPDAEPRSMFLYFDVLDSATTNEPVYVVVEYFDGAPAGALDIEYDSDAGDEIRDRYRPSDNRWGGWLTGRDEWRTAVYLLDRPRFAGRQNLGADFRIGGGPLYVRSVRLVDSLPENADELNQLTVEELAPRVTIGAGGQLIMGGWDPDSRDGYMKQVKSLEQAMPMLKSLGFTSHEGYVRWNLCEIAPGEYDWSVYDAFVDVYKRFDMKWVPFLIIGSAYSLPDWYFEKPGSQGYICLEHGEESHVQSLWNPVLRDHVARFIRAFCEHYGPTGVVESILLGITGNYGEAIYIATGNDWTASVHGEYHTHAGFWAGDPYAVADLRAWLEAKYGTVDALNAAWGTRHGAFDDVEPFLRDKAPNDRAWLDFCHWYIGSMNEYTRFWLKNVRDHFPEGDINVCTGGHAPAEHGADFGDQCKVAAEVGGGVRITNEASDYRLNFSLTRWVASAGRQYGAYYSFEPAGNVTIPGIVARVYNAAASGAKGLHYYSGNILTGEEAVETFVEWGDAFRQYDPIVEVAVYYPETHILLNGQKFLQKIEPLRDFFDFGYRSDHQILDGGLENVKALILLDGHTSEKEVWDAIIEWVRKGGLLFYRDGIGRLRTVEGDESVHEALLGDAADLGTGRVVAFSGSPEDYRTRVAEELAKAPEVSEATRRMAALDGQEDGVFATVVASDTLLWLNYTDETVEKEGLKLPPISITSQSL